MAAAYGVDVLDPGLSLRRFWTLAQRLPPHARNGGEPWSTEAHLLAVLADNVAALTYVTMRAAGAKNARRPKPLPRPAVRSEPAAEAPRPTWAQALAAIAAMPGVEVDDEDGEG